ncbi:zinc-dependent peptidase [Comamonas sp.]|uniref:M90 family metallopeptidase n=1 Tax=Comamonas sp. TaxID=34028 RepID=UPI003FA537AB
MPMWKKISDWLRPSLPGRLGTPPEIPDNLWQSTLQQYAFLQQLSPQELLQLRALCAHFLQRKQFSGANGLEITDAMALAVAAQACVLLIHWGTPQQALRWYDDFVGIIIYPGDVIAHRTTIDAAGVVHHYSETLMGEAMERGPVTLSWTAIQPGGHPHLGAGSNVVIHEFAHKLDMANGGADGCPPLPAGFMGYTSSVQAQQLWSSTWLAAYETFCEALAAHERFGQPAPWLDAYGATDPAEFFAVACEAYWVAPAQFAQALPTLPPLLDALFQRHSTHHI